MCWQKESRAQVWKRAVENDPFRRAFGGTQLASFLDELLGFGLGVGLCFSGVFDIDAGRGHLVLNRNL